MIHKTPLPKDIEQRLGSLGQALDRCPRILFAYLFGGATVSPLKPLSDVDEVRQWLIETSSSGSRQPIPRRLTSWARPDSWMQLGEMS